LQGLFTDKIERIIISVEQIKSHS